MWGVAIGIVALLGAAGVWDWRVRRRGGRPSVDPHAVRDARQLGESEANQATHGRLRDGGPFAGGSGF